MNAPRSRATALPRTRLAADIGGTFTDVVCVDTANGAIRFTKVMTNYRDIVAGVIDGISKILRDLVAEGRQVGAVAYQQALDDAKGFASSLAEYLEDCSAIITPATTGVAPKGIDATGNPLFCTLWTLSGLPSLSLPLDVVSTLALIRQSGGTAVLADGSIRQFDLFAAEVAWDGHWRAVLVSAVGKESLLGMRLLAGHELKVEVVPGGNVEILPLT